MAQREDELPDPKPVIAMINGFRRSKVLFTLVSLRIPEVMAARNNEGSLEQVAADIGAHLGYLPSLDGLQRLLDGAVSLGLLTGDRESYRLSEMSQAYLVPSAEFSLTGYIAHSDKLLYKLWTGLETSVCTGVNCWRDVFGLDSRDVFASMYNEPSAVLRFMDGMHSFAKLSAQPILAAFDLSAYRTLVDLGGASGALAIAACQMFPAMRGIVVDLPNVIDKARQHFTQPPYVTQQSVLDRLSWVAADFFEADSPVPQGDLYVLARILHDWDDVRCLKVLRLVWDKLAPGGAVLLCEMILDESGTSPPDALLQTLNMLTQTHGRERKLSEYRHLLETAGFEGVDGRKTGTWLDAIVAYKPPVPVSAAAGGSRS